MKKSILREYARLIVRVGANVQQGQEVRIRAGLDQPEFVTMVVEEAYRAGARKVIMEWFYQPISKLDSRYQTVETMGTVEEWEKARMEHNCAVVPVRIFLDSADPDGMKGDNAQKRSEARKLSYPILKPYTDRLEGHDQWCIAAVPGAAWARKVFPGLTKNQAVEKLWEAILFTSRVTDDPVKAWQEHDRNLAEHCRRLNDLQITSLHYTAQNGTDFTVGLIPEAQFCGGDETSLDGITFNPNIPTEECFTSPRRGDAEGIVYATKPLSYQGQLIDHFSIRFEQGRAVEVHAETGEELLRTMISMDEGAAYLGECALVPQASPIAESGLLFYNTLFDENAACHLALGMGFMDCIRVYSRYTLDEVRKLGINDSMIHVDFMIGCDSMNIDALCADGTTVRIFENGNWAI